MLVLSRRKEQSFTIRVRDVTFKVWARMKWRNGQEEIEFVWDIPDEVKVDRTERLEKYVTLKQDGTHG